MTPWGYGWRFAALVFIVLLLALTATGFVAVQLDDQYDGSAWVARPFMGVIAGAYSAAILSPAAFVLAMVSGSIAGLRRARQMRRNSGQPRVSGPTPPAMKAR